MSEASKPHRGARRKARTREKLLEAGRRLFIGKGFEGVSIQDITDLADVGFGTFYNHFESKTDLLEAVADAYLDRHDEEMDRLTEQLEDPAEIVCVGWRYTLACAADPERFAILHQIPSILRSRIAQRALDDIHRGIATGRLKVDNLEAFRSCVPSMMLGVMEDYAAGVISREDADYSAVYYLRLLGIDEAEAVALASRPMPRIPLTPPAGTPPGPDPRSA